MLYERRENSSQVHRCLLTGCLMLLQWLRGLRVSQHGRLALLVHKGFTQRRWFRACLFQQQYFHHVVIQQRRLIYVEVQWLRWRYIQLIICHIRQPIPLLHQESCKASATARRLFVLQQCRTTDGARMQAVMAAAFAWTQKWHTAQHCDVL